MPRKKSSPSSGRKKAASNPRARKKAASKRAQAKKAKQQRQTRLRIGLVIVVAALALLMVVSLFNNRLPSQGSRDIVAMVNGEPITQKELDYSYQLSVPEQYWDRITKQAFLNDSVIPQKLIVQRAEASNITITERDIDQAIEETANFYGLTEQELESRLGDEGLTMEDMRQTYRSRLLLATFLEKEVFSGIEIRGEAVEEAYAESDYAARNISLEEARPFLSQQLRQRKEDAAFSLYVRQLRQRADITITAALKTEVVQSFTATGEIVCLEDGKPVIEAFTAHSCQTCAPAMARLKTLLEGYQAEGNVVGHIWELDTGDDLMTTEVESGVPPASVERFKRFNPDQTVPSYVFGCAFVRAGHLPGGEGNVNAEAQEFTRAIEAVLAQ